MTTATLHDNVRLNRFAQRAVEVLATLLSVGSGNSKRTLGTADGAALEAQKVRRMAHAYAKTDPGFAADLYAAAARHEGIHAE